jgi:hypothetical protein
MEFSCFVIVWCVDVRENCCSHPSDKALLLQIIYINDSLPFPLYEPVMQQTVFQGLMSYFSHIMQYYNSLHPRVVTGE